MRKHLDHAVFDLAEKKIDVRNLFERRVAVFQEVLQRAESEAKSVPRFSAVDCTEYKLLNCRTLIGHPPDIDRTSTGH